MTKQNIFMMGFILLFASISLASISSAWPYELYSNGTIVDLNSSNNLTTTLEITYYGNYTNVNYTDITYRNYTTITEESYTNRSYWYNVTNQTNIYYTINGSAVYNTTEADAKFLDIITFNDYKNTPKTKESHGLLWGFVIASLLMSLASLVIIYRAGAV